MPLHGGMGTNTHLCRALRGHANERQPAMKQWREARLPHRRCRGCRTAGAYRDDEPGFSSSPHWVCFTGLRTSVAPKVP